MGIHGDMGMMGHMYDVIAFKRCVYAGGMGPVAISRVKETNTSPGCDRADTDYRELACLSVTTTG